MKKIIAVFTIAVMAASCHNGDKEKEAAAQAQHTIDSMKMEIAKQRVIDSMNEVAKQDAALVAEPVVAVSHKKHSTTHSNSNGSYATTNSQNNSTPVTDGTTTTTTTKKKGWSAKAKGAAIGAGAGAITGAVISKNQKAKGAIIGGVLGAGAGLGVGAIIDKKQGR